MKKEEKKEKMKPPIAPRNTDKKEKGRN